MSELWERAKGESSKAYAHFCLYRDMGTLRSLRDLAKGGKATSKVRQLTKWSSRWKWVDRAAAYDDELERQRRQTNELERRRMAERHAKLSTAAQNILVGKLNEWTQQPPRNLSFEGAMRILDIAVKIERLSRGEPTEIAKSEHSGPGGGPMEFSTMTSEERRREMVRLLTEELGKKPEEAEELAQRLMLGGDR